MGGGGGIMLFFKGGSSKWRSEVLDLSLCPTRVASAGPPKGEGFLEGNWLWGVALGEGVYALEGVMFFFFCRLLWV